MTPETEKQYREFFRQKFTEGRWRWIGFLLIYFFSGISGHYLLGWLGVPRSSPDSDPPWYFIRRDFFAGVTTFAGIIVILLMVALTWRRYAFNNWMLLLMVSIWMIPSVVRAIIIYVRCSNFFDYDRAISAWPTFNDYLHSGVGFVGIPIGLVIAMIVALPDAWSAGRKLANSLRGAAAD